MKPSPDSSKGPRKWSRWSLWSNLAAIVIVGAQYYTQIIWIIFLADVLVLAGLAFFFKALYDCVRARTWGALAAFLPAMVLQIAILVTVGVAVWYFWSKPDSAHS